MENNTFKIRRLAKWRAETEEMFRAVGLRQAQYMDDVGALSDLYAEKVLSDSSQFLFAFDDVGAQALAERTGKCPKTMHNWRKNILNEICKKATG